MYFAISCNINIKPPTWIFKEDFISRTWKLRIQYMILYDCSVHQNKTASLSNVHEHVWNSRDKNERLQPNSVSDQHEHNVVSIAGCLLWQQHWWQTTAVLQPLAAPRSGTVCSNVRTSWVVAYQFCLLFICDRSRCMSLQSLKMWCSSFWGSFYHGCLMIVTLAIS